MRNISSRNKYTNIHQVASLACAFVSSVECTGLAADSPTNTVTKAVSAASGEQSSTNSAMVAVKPVVSAGILNDWLRDQSPSFQKWDLGGQLRMRYEMKENAGSFPQADFIARRLPNDNEYLLLRERLHVGYKPVNWFNAYVEAQDSSEHWDERKPSPDADIFDLRQAYVDVGDAKQFPLSLKVGRQEIAYGDERIIGRGDWSNTGRVFDAAKLRTEGTSGWMDAFVSRVVVPYDEHFNEDNSHDWFSGIYGGTRTIVPWQETHLYVVTRNYSAEAPNDIAPGVPGSPKTARDIVTFGTLWRSLPGKLAGWDYSLETVGQLGTINSNNQRLDQRSYALFANVGYTFTNAPASPRLGLGYDYGSGDGNNKDGTVETFENVFGTQHKPYGLMDLFGARNMHIPKFGVSAKPVKGLTLTADYLLYIMADTHDYLYPESGSGRSSNGYGIHPGYSSFVGSELDCVANYSFKSWGNLQAGYGHFFVSDYIQQSVDGVASNGGATDADWFYTQIIFNF